MLNKILLLVSLVFILTGCNLTVRVEVNKKSSGTKEIEEQSNTAIDEDKDIIIKLLNDLSKEIATDKSVEEIEEMLEKHSKTSAINMSNIYYFSSDGTYTIIPGSELPKDFDFRELDPYKKAVEQGIYISDPYKNFSNDKGVQTICVRVNDEDIMMGVIGIDFYR